MLFSVSLQVRHLGLLHACDEVLLSLLDCSTYSAGVVANFLRLKSWSLMLLPLLFAIVMDTFSHNILW